MKEHVFSICILMILIITLSACGSVNNKTDNTPAISINNHEKENNFTESKQTKPVEKNYDNLYLPDWIRWDMNIEEVKDVCNREIKGDISRRFIRYLTFKNEETDFFNYDFEYVCIFNDEKLKSYFIQCDCYLETYDQIKKIVTEKYGQPITDTENWTDNTYKNNPEKRNDAFEYGYFSLKTRWKINNTIIVLSWSNDSSSLAYCDISFEKNL